MPSELDVLEQVGQLLDGAQVPFMLTGSFAMAYYATPRMTRDLDIVVELNEGDAERVAALFDDAFFVDIDDVRIAITNRRMFNLMHSKSGIKVDLILRKDSEFRKTELARRKKVQMGTVATWIVSREDLILSKLVWGRESQSEMQRRDVLALAQGPLDRPYLEKWSVELGIKQDLDEVLP